jgi:hypothetical protein
MVERFSVVPKDRLVPTTELAQMTVEPDPDGAYALIEFTQALPRAKLYSNWQVVTNDQAVLDQLPAVSFDPERSVFVAGGVPAAQPVVGTNENAGTVEFGSYAPKDIVLRSDARSPSVLLLNDRFDPNWNVTVDGKRETLLRCNYIMRGVYLSPGAHTVEFRFQPPLGPLCLTLATIGVGLLLLGFVFVTGWRSDHQAPAKAPQPAPPSPPSPPQRTPQSAEGKSNAPGRSWKSGSVSLGRQGTR